MYKFIRSKFFVLLFALVAIAALSGIRQISVMADTTKTDPSLSYSGTVVVHTGTTTASAIVDGGIVISIDNTASPSDLIAGSAIVLEAPSGTRFTVGSGSSLVNPTGFAYVTIANPTAANTGVTTLTFQCPGSTTQQAIVTTTASTAVGTGVIDRTAFSADDTKITLNIVSITSTGSQSATIIIGGGTSTTQGTSALSTSIGLLPTPTARNSDTNTASGTIKATTNANSSSANTGNVGTVHLLAAPKIVDAVMVDTSTVDVTFNVEVNNTNTANIQAPSLAAFRVNANGAAGWSGATFAAAGTRLADAAGAVITSPVSGDYKKVRLALGGAGPLDFTGAPTVALNGTEILANKTFAAAASGSNTGVYNTDNVNSLKPFPIRKSSSTALSSVTLNKTTVGAMARPGTNGLANNKLSATFVTSSASQPVKFKFVRTNDAASNPSPLDTGALIAAATSAGMSVTIGGENVAREDTAADGATATTSGDIFNRDVFVIPGSKMTAGAATVDIALGATVDAFDAPGELDGYGTSAALTDNTTYSRRNGVGTATAITLGNEVGIKIAASVDDFNTIVKSGEVVVDKAGPVVLSSGTDAPTAPSRNQVNMKFDSDLDGATATDLTYWAVRDATGSQTVSSVTIASDKRSVSVNTSSLFGLGSVVSVWTRTFGTPTASLEDTYYNPLLTIPTTTFTAGVPYGATWTQIGTATAPTGSSSGVTISPVPVGNTDVSNTSNTLQVTITAGSGQAAANFHLQAFDATAGFSTPQSTQVTGATMTVPLQEISDGVYRGTLTLYGGLSSAAIKVWVVNAATAPVSESDWSTAVKSNSINVDNVRPTVNTPGAYAAAASAVTVQFSEGMNVTVLTTKGNYPVVRNKTVGGTIDVLSVTVSSDKQQATYKLQAAPNDTDTYIVDFNALTTDDAGNAMTNADVAGVDRAEFTTTSVIPTPTPTPTATATGTVTPTPTPTATPTPTPETGSIAGVVSDAVTGSPISGAAVALDGPSNTTTTNSSGAYAFTGVSVASHTVVAAKTGYTQNTVPVSASDFVAVGGQLVATADIALTPTTPVICDVATSIQTSPSGEMTTVKGEGDTITVAVRGADDCPVAGATVKAHSNDTSIVTVDPKKATTNAQGLAQFTVTGKKKGSAKVTIKESTAGLKAKIKVKVTK